MHAMMTSLADQKKILFPVDVNSLNKTNKIIA